MTDGRKKPAAKKPTAKKSTSRKTPTGRSSAGGDLRRKISGWCAAEAVVEVVGDRKDASHDLVLVLQATGPAPERAEVRVPKGGDRLEIARSWAVGLPADRESALLTEVQGALVTAPPLTRAELRREDDGAYLDVASTVYLDGLSQHTFMAGLDAALRASRTAAPIASRAGARDALEPAPEEEPAEAPAATPAAFTATHEVPAGGMQAWAAPDPEGPVAAELQARVQLRVLEERGAWARVEGSNGWTGWVDGRRLKEV